MKTKTKKILIIAACAVLGFLLLGAFLGIFPGDSHDDDDREDKNATDAVDTNTEAEETTSESDIVWIVYLGSGDGYSFNRGYYSFDYQAGDTVTFALTVDDGYELESVNVLDEADNSFLFSLESYSYDGTYLEFSIPSECFSGLHDPIVISPVVKSQNIE